MISSDVTESHAFCDNNYYMMTSSTAMNDIDRRQSSSTLIPSRIHSRSASWSFTGTTRPTASDLSAGLSSINPIRSVIREFMPSLGTQPELSAANFSRSNSQLSLNITPASHDNSPPPPPRIINTSHTPSITREPSINSLGSDNSRQQPFADNNGINNLNNNNNVDETNVEMSEWVKWIEQNVIFVGVLLIRYSWIHGLGLLVLIGMFATYLHCNKILKNQVALKNRRDKKILLLIILLLCGNIYFVYDVFSVSKLHNCLIFIPPLLFLDLWNLIWSICVTDFIIRFGTMVLKALVALCFLCILPSRKKGKYYMLLEHLSQFYRTIVPTPLWFGFCSNYSDTGAVFAIIITASYLMIKGAVILARGRELFRAVCSFINDKAYGILLKKEDLLESCDTVCPICQDDYNTPIMLRCKHVFCESCVLQWFDRERTCPLCRSNIGSDPKWRDGSTSAWPQIF